jgi:hypothetical protein
VEVLCIFSGVHYRVGMWDDEIHSEERADGGFSSPNKDNCRHRGVLVKGGPAVSTCGGGDRDAVDALAAIVSIVCVLRFL